MKKILTISIFSALALLNCGCQESFLDKEPPIDVTEKDIFSNPTRIENNLLGVYSTLKMDDPSNARAFIGGKMLVVFDNRGEDLINISNNGVTLFFTYQMSTSDADSENQIFWRIAYLAINNANTFLDNLDNIAGAKELVGASYNQYVAEAKFVRSMAYYYLSMIYSMPYVIDPNAKAVPLRTAAERDNTNNNLKRSSISEVLNFILTDMSDATVAALPANGGTYNTVTRATQGAALMLRMRVKMAMGDLAGAITDGNQIKTLGYLLTPSVATAFSSTASVENIFSFPMELNNVPNTQYSLVEYYYGSPRVMAINRTAPGVYSDPNYSQATDARISLLTETSGSNLLLKKFTASTKLDWVPIFRYAETLLNLAECYASQGGAAETQAKNLLKEVRRRSVKAADDAMTDAAIDALTGVALKNAISKERRLEFLGEGIRGIDIIRRGETFPAKGTGGSAVGAVSPTTPGYIWDISAGEKAINKDL